MLENILGKETPLYIHVFKTGTAELLFKYHSKIKPSKGDVYTGTESFNNGTLIVEQVCLHTQVFNRNALTVHVSKIGD